MLKSLPRQLICTCRSRSAGVARLNTAPPSSPHPSTPSTSSSSLSDFASVQKGLRTVPQLTPASSLHAKLMSRRESRTPPDSTSSRAPAPKQQVGRKRRSRLRTVEVAPTDMQKETEVDGLDKKKESISTTVKKVQKMRDMSPEDQILADAFKLLPQDEKRLLLASYRAFLETPWKSWAKLSNVKRRKYLWYCQHRFPLELLNAQQQRLGREVVPRDRAVAADAEVLYREGVKGRQRHVELFRVAMSSLGDATSSSTRIADFLAAKESFFGQGEDKAPSSSTSTDSSPSRDPPPHLNRLKTISPTVSRELSSYAASLSSTDAAPKPLAPTQTQPAIATLAHGLSRVLYNPGIHFLRDPRSQVYNFPPSLDKLPHVDEFEFDKMPQYITSSKDVELMELAEREGKTFVSSTSSTVGMLCQIYFWLSKGKKPNYSMLSQQWHDQLHKSEKDFKKAMSKRGGPEYSKFDREDFTAGQQMPASIIMHEKDGRYSVDADKTFDAGSDINILSLLGHLMEKLLTTEETEFSRFLKDSDNPAPSLANDRQAYHYATTEHMVMRSQLDATDPHLPRQTFDVKTRGSVAVRHDRLNYAQASGYTVDRLRGSHESFEREYYDLIRSAFLKYSFQARIGHMDGCFLAYHSTTRFFGFQYIPLEEMYEALFGHAAEGEPVFTLCVGFLEKLLLQVKEAYPGRSLRATFAADVAKDVLRVFVQPVAYSEGEEPHTTLLELRGTNYIDGQAEKQVSIAPVTTRSDFHPPRLPRWDVGFEIERHTTSDTTTGPDILGLLAKVRETQEQFNTITLPEGVTNADLLAAAEAVKAGEAAPDLLLKFPLDTGIEYRDNPTFLVRSLRKLAVSSDRRRQASELQDSGKKLIELQTSLKV